MPADVIAVDWGTTNRRVYRLSSEGVVRFTERDACGILSVAPGTFENEMEVLRARHGALPLVLAGMIGSSRGWMAVPYVPVPAGCRELAAGMLRIEDRIAIVPGVCRQATNGHADVMRGEEVQFVGAVAAKLVPAKAFLCQPGTHCKWARMEHGKIVDFTTAMTGEIFALLKTHSLLSEHLREEITDDEAFAQGLAAARHGDLLATLFGVRAAILLGSRNAATGASYVSGLLIGADVSARLRDGGKDVYVLADADVGALYARAIGSYGGSAHVIDSHAAFVAGINQIWSLTT